MKRRLLSFGILLAFAAAYLGFVVSTIDALAFGEETFDSSGPRDAAPVNVYVDVLGVDAVREVIQLRFDIAGGTGAHGRRYFGTATRDLDVRIGDGDTERSVRIHRNEPIPTIAFDADLSGDLAAFPFDSYVLRAFVRVFAPVGKTAREVPVRLTVWEGEPGWRVRAVKPRAANTRELALTFHLRRRSPLIFFACAVYAVMVLIAVGALAICTTVLVRTTRSPAETLIGALAAMVFALPVLRTNIPGAPPLGVGADLFIFLWAEVAAAVSLAAVVFAWVRRTARSGG